jgi:hypothetical protein
MFLPEAYYISLYLFAASIAAAPSPNPNFSDGQIPSLRIPREEVQAMKEGQTNPPGHIHRYVTLGKGSDAVSVPIVEADLNTLLDDEVGVRARSLAQRDNNCLYYSPLDGSCNINYCWRDKQGNYYTEYLTITGSDGQSDPKSLTGSNSSNLYLPAKYDDGFKHWFPYGHACSNSDTQIYTSHLYAGNIYDVAFVYNLRCDTCDFDGIKCKSSDLAATLVAYTNGGPAIIQCQLDG